MSANKSTAYLVGCAGIFLLLDAQYKVPFITIAVVGWLVITYLDMPGTKDYDLVRGLIASRAFVASKSYCPYCKATLQFLKENKVDTKVIQLDQMANGARIQNALARITGQNTVPFVFLAGKFVGGNDALHALGSENVKKVLAKFDEEQKAAKASKAGKTGKTESS